MNRDKARSLRLKGMTYTEIKHELGISIPKSTLSYWCRDIQLSEQNQIRIHKINQLNLLRGRQKALKNKQISRQNRVLEFEKTNRNLFKAFKQSRDTKKIALAMLYIAEGHKHKSSLAFGNSDAYLIGLFLSLLRQVYEIDERKFRLTVQCRFDQDIKALEKFWSKVTKIPKNQFYKAQVDKRTVGKPSKNKNYKGVCRIDYFSALIDQELKFIARSL